MSYDGYSEYKFIAYFAWNLKKSEINA